MMQYGRRSVNFLIELIRQNHSRAPLSWEGGLQRHNSAPQVAHLLMIKYLRYRYMLVQNAISCEFAKDQVVLYGWAILSRLH